MGYTRFALPDFNQNGSSSNNYPIGSFQAAAGQWVRVTLTFNARPIATQLGPPGTYYVATVAGPDGSITRLALGQLTGGWAWYPGGIIGAFQAPAGGIYTLSLDTTPYCDHQPDLSGCCQYSNVTAVVETPSVLTSGTAPVTVLTLPGVTVDPGDRTFPLGAFPAVIGQDYKLTCAFDAGQLTGGNLAYNLSGSGFTNLPDGFLYNDPAWSKCYVTGVVTAQATTCDIDLFASVASGSASILNGSVIIEPFVSPITA